MFILESGPLLTKSVVERSIQNQNDPLRGILNWFSQLNYWSQQNDNFERAEPGTGEWLLDDPKFESWIKGEARILWCPGDRKSLIANAEKLTMY